MHALTGSVSTSIFFEVDKLKAMKRLLKAQESANLIHETIGLNMYVTEDMLESAKEFLQYHSLCRKPKRDMRRNRDSFAPGYESL